jgi:hypothetical protein
VSRSASSAEQRRQEPLGDLLAHLGVGREPRPPGLDVFAGPVRQLAYRRRRPVHDFGDLGVRIAEHVAEDEYRALQRGQRLQHHHHRERHRLGRLLRLGRGIDERLGQPWPEIRLLPSTAMRTRYARGLSTSEPPPLRFAHASHVSCSTSSVSATLPSMLYAIENSRSRWRTKSRVAGS